MFYKQQYYKNLCHYLIPTVTPNPQYGQKFQKYIRLPFLKTSIRTFSAVKSRTNFNDYEKARSEFVWEIPEKFNFASDVLDVWAQKEVNLERTLRNPAFWFVYENGKEIKWNYRNLAENSKRIANVLEKECGLKKGDSLMVLLPKLPEFWLVYVAAIRTGVIISPCSIQMRENDIRYRLKDLKPKCIVAEEEVVEIVDKALVGYPDAKAKILVSLSGNERSGWLNFQDLYNKASPDHECVETASDDPMLIYFTSGTTGFPKMVEHTQASYGIGQYTTGRYVMDLTEHDISWNVSDTGWIKTAYFSIFGAWNVGACIFMHQMQKFDASLVTKILKNYPITTLCAPATVYRKLLQQEKSNLQFPSLTHCTSGGEPVMSEIIIPWEKITGNKIYGNYGQTETAILLSMYKCLKFKYGSMGKPPPGINIAIIDENENELGPNEVGEIAVKLKPIRPVGLFTCYKNDPEKTKSQLTENYYRTGDMAYYDEDGYFWFKGRTDDIINSAGYRIGPIEVEDVLLKHEAVIDVGVVSSPDPERGEVVKAFIILSEEFENYDKAKLTEELQSYAKNNTAPYKYPRKIVYVKELPRTVNGKVKRSDLRMKEWGHE